MIPKKIHYCWFGGKALPKEVKKCIKSWKKHCPDYEIIEWNESNFDIHCNNFIKKAYEEKCWAFVSDYARLKIIYDNGGIYLDTDVELLKSLDTLLHEECYFAAQEEDKKLNSGLGFGARKHHPIIKELLDCYDNAIFDKEQKFSLACPILTTNLFEQYGYHFKNEIMKMENIDVTIYPPKYFDPISPGSIENLMDKDTYSIHHYSASWIPNLKGKRKLSRFIGQKNINAIKRIIKKK